MTLRSLIFRKKKFEKDNDKHVPNLQQLEDWAKQVKKTLDDHETRLTGHGI